MKLKRIRQDIYTKKRDAEETDRKTRVIPLKNVKTKKRNKNKRGNKGCMVEGERAGLTGKELNSDWPK